MEITRIKPFKFKVGRYSLNESELRYLMLEIFLGRRPEMIGKTIKDCKGNVATFRFDGKLTENVYGFSLNSMLTLDMIQGEKLSNCRGIYNLK